MENYLMGHQKLIFDQTSDDVLQELSWGFRAFYVLVWTRFDTLSFCCWMGDKINSCHLYGMDGEMCGLADYWSYHDNQEIFSSKTTLWFFIWFFIFCHRVCVIACVVCCPCLGVMCVRVIHSQVFVRGAPHWPNKPVEGDVWRNVHM